MRRVICTMDASGPLFRIKQTVATYCWQTHPDRALDIYAEPDDHTRLKRFADTIPHSQKIRVLNTHDKSATSVADDDLWCPLRPGDISHPRRLELQAKQALLQASKGAWLSDVAVLIEDVAECVLIRSGPNHETTDDAGGETYLGIPANHKSDPQRGTLSEGPRGLLARVRKSSSPEWRSQLLANSWTADAVTEHRGLIVRNLEQLPLPRPYVLIGRDAQTGASVCIPRG